MASSYVIMGNEVTIESFTKFLQYIIHITNFRHIFRFISSWYYSSEIVTFVFELSKFII